MPDPSALTLGALARSLPGLALRHEPEPDLWVDGRRADVVAEPADEAELAALLHVASREGLALHLRGTGAQEASAEPVERLDVVVSLRRLAGIVRHEPGDLTCTAWAGTTLADLDRHLAGFGQRLAIEPVAAQATLGGLVATGASGPFRLGFGTPRDRVLGLRLALTDGQLVRTGSGVVKNVAGYDLTRLMVGSLGTLAAITQVTVRVSPRAAAHATVWMATGEVGAALDLGWRLRRGGLEPVALEALDAQAAEAAGRGATAGLLVAFEDVPAAVDVQCELARNLAGKASVDVLGPAAGMPLWRHLHTAPASAPLVLRVGVPPSALLAVYAAADAWRRRYGAPLASSLSVAVGAARLWALDDLEEGTWDSLVTTVRAAAEAADGVAVLERSPLALRRRLGVFGRPPAGIDRMRRMKETFDPRRVLSPGRFVGGL